MVVTAAVVVLLLLVLSPKPVPPPPKPLNGIPDSDGDGIPDDVDLFIGGDAGIRVTVFNFTSPGGCSNWISGQCDPEFRHSVDGDLDGEWEPWNRTHLGRSNHIDLVLSHDWNVPDDATRTHVWLKVKDLDGGEDIDYKSVTFPEGGAYFVISLRQGPQESSFKGRVTFQPASGCGSRLWRFRGDDVGMEPCGHRGMLIRTPEGDGTVSRVFRVWHVPPRI